VKRFWLPLLFLIAGVLISFYPLFASHFTLLGSDPVDPRLNNLILERIWEWTKDLVPTQSFFDVPYYYPSTHVGTWTDTLWGAAPLYVFMRNIGLPMTDAFSGWIIGLSVLNFWCAYWALRKPFQAGALGASLGAYLFAFSTPRLAQIGHAQLFPAFATPLFFAWLYEACKDLPKLNRMKFTLAMLALIFQIYAGFYLGWFLVLTLVLGALYLLVRKNTRPLVIKALQNEWKFLGILGAASVVLLLPQFLPYVDSAKMFGKRPYSAIRETFPRLLSYFHVGTEHPYEGWVSKLLNTASLPASHEHKMGIGIFTSILVLFGFYQGRKTSLSLRSAGILALILFGISISFFGVSLWGLIYLFFPGGGAIRVASRIILTLLFLYSVSLAYTVEKIPFKFRWLAVILVLFEQAYLIPTHVIQEVQTRVAQLTTQVPYPCHLFYAMGSVPGLRDDETQMDLVYVAHNTGRETVNGYFGHDPIGWQLSPGNEQKLEEWEQLKGFKIPRSCVIHLGQN
jgi:hypothetical protein